MRECVWEREACCWRAGINLGNLAGHTPQPVNVYRRIGAPKKRTIGAPRKTRECGTVGAISERVTLHASCPAISVCVSERESVYVCKCVRERVCVRERERVHVCVRERESECV